MANHDILLTSANWSTDLGQTPMDDESFRRMAEDVKRPRSTSVSVFRHVGPTLEHTALVPQDAEQTALSTPQLSPTNPDRVWESLSAVSLNEARLVGNGLYANPKQSPEVSYFDILRTRLLHAMQDHGWKRIAITSPTHGCGKSFVAANLALSLARRQSSRTVLLDMELRTPALARLFGLSDIGPIREFLSGEQPLESQFRRVGQTLALGLNGVPVPAAAELLHEPSTAETLAQVVSHLDPDLVIMDAPPVLIADEMLALLPKVDAVLLIVDGTKTTADEVRTCERLFEGQCPLMGVVLNRAQDRGLGRYRH